MFAGLGGCAVAVERPVDGRGGEPTRDVAVGVVEAAVIALVSGAAVPDQRQRHGPRRRGGRPEHARHAFRTAVARRAQHVEAPLDDAVLVRRLADPFQHALQIPDRSDFRNAMRPAERVPSCILWLRG